MLNLVKKKSIFSSILIVFILFILDLLFTLSLYSITNNDNLSNIISSLLLIILITYFNKEYIFNSIKELKNINKLDIIKILIIFIIGFISSRIININLINILNIEVTNEVLVKESIKNSIILSSISTIIIAPIKEELIYRLPFIYNNNKILNYIIYSLIFASIHLLTINNIIEILFIIPYLILSFSIGYGLYKTDNILVSTILHILNNLFNIMLLLV